MSDISFKMFGSLFNRSFPLFLSAPVRDGVPHQVKMALSMVRRITRITSNSADKGNISFNKEHNFITISYAYL